MFLLLMRVDDVAKRWGFQRLLELLFGGAVVWFSSILTNKTDMLDIGGGGGKLFGGSYLICIYVGMLIGKHYKRLISRKSILVLVTGTGICACFVVLLWRINGKYGFFLDNAYGIFGEGINPPGLQLIPYAISVTFLLFFGVSLLEIFSKNILINSLIEFGSLLGRHTLYVFLFHRLFLDYLLVRLNIECNAYLKCIVYYVVMIGGSLIIEVVCGYVRRWVGLAYSYKRMV